jgi:hypothetical protein
VLLVVISRDRHALALPVVISRDRHALALLVVISSDRQAVYSTIFCSLDEEILLLFYFYLHFHICCVFLNLYLFISHSASLDSLTEGAGHWRKIFKNIKIKINFFLKI